MKRSLLISIFVATIVFSFSFPAHAEFGLGYQGILSGDYLQGISARGWSSNVGFELNLFQAEIELDAEDLLGIDEDAEIWLYSGKLLLAAITRENSRFYWGLEAGMGTVEFGDEEVDVLLYGLLFGAEYRFQELPELGFNWETGYRFTDIEYEDDDLDSEVGINGIWVSIGIHYYF